MDIEAITRDWSIRGFSCELWADPPGQRWENFVHDVDELLMPMEGELEIVLAGEILHPKPTTEVFIPAGTVHSVRNIGKRGARWLYGYKHSPS